MCYENDDCTELAQGRARWLPYFLSCWIRLMVESYLHMPEGEVRVVIGKSKLILLVSLLDVCLHYSCVIAPVMKLVT